MLLPFFRPFFKLGFNSIYFILFIIFFLDILQMTGIMSDEPETNTTAPQHQQQSQNTNDIQQRLTTARNTTTLQKGE